MREKIRKIIAAAVLTAYAGSMIPAAEYRQSIETSGEHLERKLERIKEERSEESWKAQADRYEEEAYQEWEKANEYQKEKDAEAYSESRKDAEKYLKLRKEKKYAEWIIGQAKKEMELEGLREIRTRIKEAVRNYEEEEYRETEAAEKTEKIKELLEKTVEKYIKEYEAEQDKKADEIKAAIEEAGIDIEEIAKEIEEEINVEAEVIREGRQLARKEGSRLTARYISDTNSLKAEKAAEAAGEIADRIISEAEKESRASVEELFSKIEKEVKGEEPEGSEGTAAGEIEEAIKKGLNVWKTAEEEYLRSRMEWEAEGNATYEEGMKTWEKAYERFKEKREEWEGSINRKIEELSREIEERNKGEETKINELKAEYEAVLAEENVQKREMAEAEKGIYINLRKGLETVCEGIKDLEEIMVEERDKKNKYDGLYSYWKTEAAEKIDEETVKKVKEYIEANGLENDEKAKTYERWIEEAAEYNKKIKETITVLNQLTGTAEITEGKYSELQKEIAKAGLKEEYWKEEAEVAKAVEEYAEQNDGSRESRETTERKAKETAENYEQSWEKYERARETLKETEEKIQSVKRKIEEAYRGMSEGKEKVEKIKAEYQLMQAQKQGLNEYTVVNQIKTYLKYYEEAEGQRKENEKAYEEYKLNQNIEQERKEIEQNERDSKEIYDNQIGIIEELIGKLEKGAIDSSRDLEDYINGIDYEGKYKSENRIYGREEYIDEKYKEEFAKMKEILEELEEEQEEQREIEKAKVLFIAGYIKSCMEQEKGYLEGEKEEKVLEKYSERKEESISIENDEKTKREYESLKNLEEEYERKYEERKEERKEAGERYRSSKIIERNEETRKTLAEYLEKTAEGQVTEEGYGEVLKYVEGVYGRLNGISKAYMIAVETYIDSYLAEQAYKYQNSKKKTEEYYMKKLERLSKTAEEVIEDRIEYIFLSHAYEKATGEGKTTWAKELKETGYSSNKNLEKKESEEIEKQIDEIIETEQEKLRETKNKQKETITEKREELEKKAKQEELREKAQKYQAGKETADTYMLKLQICTEEYAVIDKKITEEDLQKKNREIQSAEAESRAKTEKYQKALEELRKIEKEYEETVEKINEEYKKTEEARVEKRKAQAVYDWAESIYLGTLGTNNDANYKTPKEQLKDAEYAYKRMKLSREILEEILKSRKEEKTEISIEEKEYIEKDREYYIAEAMQSYQQKEMEKTINRLMEAEIAESEARKAIVTKVEEARITEKVTVEKDEKGEYKYLLGNAAGNRDAQKEYWEKEEKVQHEITAEEYITAGEKEFIKWIKGMLGNEEYFKTVIIGSLTVDLDAGIIDVVNNVPNLGDYLGVDAKGYFKESAIKIMLNGRLLTNDEDIARYELYKNSNSEFAAVIKEIEINLITALSSLLVYQEMKNRQWWPGYYIEVGVGNLSYHKLTPLGNIARYYSIEAMSLWAGSTSRYEQLMNRLRKQNIVYGKSQKEREEAEKEYNKKLYGQEEKAEEKISGEEAKKILRELFRENKAITEEEAEKILAKIEDNNKYSNAVEAMNSAVNRTYEEYKESKERLKAKIKEAEKVQDERNAEYNAAVNRKMTIGKETSEKLREYALKASDMSLSIEERRKWAEEYEKAYAESGNKEDRTILEKLANEAYGRGTYNKSSYYEVMAEYYRQYMDPEDMSYSKQEMNGSCERYWASTGERSTDSSMVSRYYEMYFSLLEDQKEYKAAENAMKLETGYSLYKKESQDILENIKDVKRIAEKEWEKAEGKLNAEYNSWRKEFITRYEETSREWQSSYEEFLSDKQEWIDRMYLGAASETGYSEENADEEARKAMQKLKTKLQKSVERENIEADEYVETLLGESYIGKLSRHMDEMQARIDGMHLATAVQNIRERDMVEEMYAVQEMMEATTAMMKKTAGRKAAQEAGKILEEKIEEAYKGIDERNRKVEENVDQKLYKAGYMKGGNLYTRKILAHSYLVEDIYKMQVVSGYNWYRTARPELTVSPGMFEGLESEGVIKMMNTATLELDDWRAKVYGIHNGVQNIKGLLETYIGDRNNILSEMGRIMYQYEKNEDEKAQGRTELEAAPWDKKIAPAETGMMEVPSLRSIAITATAVTAAIVVTAVTSALSFGTMTAPVAMLTAMGAGAIITLSTEAAFAAADLAGGFKNWNQVGMELGVSVATSAISAAGGMAGAAIKGLGGIGGALLKTGISAATNATSTVATKAIESRGDWDAFADSMGSFDTWSGVIASSAGSLVTNSLNIMDLGTDNKKVFGFNSGQIESITKLNSTIGSLASSGLSFGLSGEATFNVLNISDFGVGSSSGLLEVSIGNNGVKGRIGTGGTDISAGTLKTSLAGVNNLNMNSKIEKAAAENKLKNAATAMRMQYGFGDEVQLKQLDDILNGKTVLGIGNVNGEAQTDMENGKRTVYLNNYKTDMTREEQLAIGIKLGHEAYRDGIVVTKEEQMVETRMAVNGHTEMASKMLGDDIYTKTMTNLIGNNQNLQMDLLAKSFGDDVFNRYVDGTYDSSADYWKLMNDGTLSYDGSGNLYDENGNLILDTGKGIQGGLQVILDISEEEAYQLLKNSKFDIDKSKTVCWDLASNEGKKIGFNNKLDSGKTYEELYKTSVITDSLTGYTATLEHQNPFVMYQDLVNSGMGPYTYDSTAITSSGGEWNGRLPIRQLSYEEWKDNNYISNPSLNMITLSNPLSGEHTVTSEFGWRNNPFNSNEESFHTGTDFSTPEGTPIYPMADGTISFIGNTNYGGNTIILEHQLSYNYKEQYISTNYFTDYLHIQTNSTGSVNSSFNLGNTVNTNNILAYSGNTGPSTGPHLHTGIHFNSITKNPYANWLYKKGHIEKQNFNNWYGNTNNFMR